MPSSRAAWYVEQVLAQAAEYSAAASAPPAGAGAVTPDYVAVALAQLGKPYRWGAAGPHAFDCSGLTSWSLAQVGVSVPRVSADQARHVAAYGHAVSVEAAAGVYGALVFRIGVSAVNHVAISLGDGRTVEAWRTGEPVQTRQLSGRRWTSAGLVPGLTYRTASDAKATARRRRGGALAAALTASPRHGRSSGSAGRTHAGTLAGTRAGSGGGPQAGTHPLGVPVGEAAGQRAPGAQVARRHLYPPVRRSSSALAGERSLVDASHRNLAGRGVHEIPGAEGARWDGSTGPHTWSASALPTTLAGAPAAIQAAVAEYWERLTGTLAGTLESLAGPHTLQTHSRVAVASQGRGVATRHPRWRSGHMTAAPWSGHPTTAHLRMAFAARLTAEADS